MFEGQAGDPSQTDSKACAQISAACFLFRSSHGLGALSSTVPGTSLTAEVREQRKDKHRQKAPVRQTGLSDGETIAPRKLSTFIIELIREAGLLQAAEQRGRVYGVELNEGGWFNPSLLEQSLWENSL